MSKAAIVGCDVIGCGWAARFLLNGWDVSVHDPDPAAADRLSTVLSNARRSLPGLYDRLLPAEGRLAMHASLAEAVRGADWVQVGRPDGLTPAEDITRHAQPTATIASSGASAQAASGWIVARAYDPVYLLPFVELSGPGGACRDAAARVRGLGMLPAIAKGHATVADRLLAAIAREASSLITDGATLEDIDDALCMGPGIALAHVGLAGIRPAIAPGSTGATDLTGAERLRDDTLVDVLRALRRTRRGPGVVIAAHEAALPIPRQGALPVTLCRQVPETWTDYNGHMSSHHYLETGSLATDGFMERVGVDAAYIAGGRSYFSVEDHVRYAAEIRAGDRITVTTQALGGDGKRVHLFHFIHRGDGRLAATMETLLLHTDLRLRRVCPPDPVVAESFASWVRAHAALGRPKDAGRAISLRPVDLSAKGTES